MQKWLNEKEEFFKILIGTCAALIVAITFLGKSDYEELQTSLVIEKNIDSISFMSDYLQKTKLVIDDYLTFDNGITGKTPDVYNSFLSKISPLTKSIDLFDYYIESGTDLYNPKSKEKYVIIKNNIIKINDLFSQAVNGIYTEEDRMQIDKENAQILVQVNESMTFLNKEIQYITKKTEGLINLNNGIQFSFVIKSFGITISIILAAIILLSLILMLIAKKT